MPSTVTGSTKDLELLDAVTKEANDFYNVQVQHFNEYVDAPEDTSKKDLQRLLARTRATKQNMINFTKKPGSSGTFRMRFKRL